MERWREEGGCWLYDDGTTRGAVLPVGDVGWEAHAVAGGRRMRVERSFTLRSAKDHVEAYAKAACDPRP
jgi:hypothetical protein